MNHNATAPHRNAPPLSSRRRNMVTIRRRVLSTSVRVGAHPYRSHTRSEMISLQTFSSLCVTAGGPPGPPPPRLPVPPSEIHQLNSISQPQKHEIDIEAFNRLWPSFNGMPLRYVRDTLSMSKGNQMLRNVRDTKILEYFSEEPRKCKVTFDGFALEGNVVPSHVLAVHQGSIVKLFPVHQIIFAANCATLPAFPNSSPEPSNDSSFQFTLPVVKLEVPSPKSFHVLHDYIYTKDTTILRQILRPPSVTQTIFNLYQQTEFIRDLWKNACALSVVDIGLYIVMQDLYVEVQNAMRRIEMGSF